MLRLFVCWLSLMCLACSEPDRAKPRAFVGRGWSATLRMDIAGNALTPKEGVTLYDFHVGSLPLLFAYVGDQAGYPHFAQPPEREHDEALASGLTAHCRSHSEGALRARECLIALPYETPTQLHIWYEQLEPKWAQIADAVIASIAPKAP